MYAILTIQMHYPPSYVLDEMEWYEVNAAMKYQHLCYKDGWEQTRFNAYVIAQVNSKNKLDMMKFMPFPWDDEQAEEVKPLTKEDISKMKARAEQYLRNKSKQIEKR